MERVISYTLSGKIKTKDTELNVKKAFPCIKSALGSFKDPIFIFSLSVQSILGCSGANVSRILLFNTDVRH
jgi:hypothetical protein